MYSIEALLNILEKNGLITKREVLDELASLQAKRKMDVN